MITDCGNIIMMSWAILLVLASDRKNCFPTKMVFLQNTLFVHSDVPLKQKANGFSFQILLTNKSVHIRHSENLKILSWSWK